MLKNLEVLPAINRNKYTLIRHSNIYGYDKFDLDKSHVFGAGLVNKVINSKNDKVIIWGKGDEGRDLLYIDDLVNFVELAIKNQKKIWYL